MTKEEFDYADYFQKKYNYDPIDFRFWERYLSLHINIVNGLYNSWLRLTESHKCQFAEICYYFRLFCDLYNNHYEDLFLFALTNNNISLWRCFLDPVSIFYFASHKDEIIGYKERFFAKYNIANRYFDRLLSVDIPRKRSDTIQRRGGDALEQYALFVSKQYELVPGNDSITIVNCLMMTKGSARTGSECRQRDLEKLYEYEHRRPYFRRKRFEPDTVFFSIQHFWEEEMEYFAIADEKEARRLYEKEREEEERKRIIAEEKRKEEERKKAALEAQRIERERQSDFNYINRHKRDALITVSSSSHCQYQGITLKPVTDFVAEFFPKFNKEARAKEISIRTGRDTSSILQEWDMAIAEGTRLHCNIDKFYHNKQGDSSRSDFNLFLDFTRDNKLTPYRSEWTIFDEESELVGTVDFLDYSNGFFTLYDWKRSKNLIDEDGIIKHNKYEHRMGYYPISDLEDLPFWHYALQQNIYRYILRKHYDITIKRMKLVVLHPSLKHYEIIDVPNMEEEVYKMIKTRL